MPHSVRETLFFFFLIFLLLALLRNQWAAASLFAAILSLTNLAQPDHPWLNFAPSFAILFGPSDVLLRRGVVAMAGALRFANVAENAPPLDRGRRGMARARF